MTAEITFQAADVTAVACDALVVNLFSGVKSPAGATGAVDGALGGLITELIARGEMCGKAGEATVIHAMGRLAARKVVVVGLGPREGFGYDEVREAAGSAARAAVKAGARTVATIVHGAGVGGLDRAPAAAAVALGSLLGTHASTSHKGRKADGQPCPELGQLIIVDRNAADLGQCEAGVRRATFLAAAQAWARNLVAEPANRLGPADLATRAAEMARVAGLECEVLGQPELEAIGARAILGVATGSAREPKMIVIRHRGGRSDGPWLGLVGKAITFDSGGLSLKDRDGMHMMKDDMAGGAAVLAAARACAELRLPVNVLAVVPAVENMPSGTAQRPGDVVQALDGQTIEIISTDAEGRLVLADAVTYAVRQGVKAVVDAATLTGACVVALGKVYSGLVSTDEDLARAVLDAAAAAGERVWRLPSHPLYLEQLESKIADLKNSGGREGGAITGGLFIGKFAAGVPWAHLDIAGTCWTDKDLPDCPEGPTGVATRTLVALAERWNRE